MVRSRHPQMCWESQQFSTFYTHEAECYTDCPAVDEQCGERTAQRCPRSVADATVLGAPGSANGRLPRDNPTHDRIVCLPPAVQEGDAATVRNPVLPVDESGVFDDRALLRYRLQYEEWQR